MPSRRFELLFLPGLDDVVAAEVASVLKVPVRRVVGRNDSFSVPFNGRWDRLLSLRTVVAVFAVLTFPVPRPRSLLSGEHFPAILETIDRVSPDARSFRFDAAGADSSVVIRLANRLASATCLRHDPAHGDIVLRFRRSTCLNGWDLLIRLSTRPLADRPRQPHRRRPGRPSLPS